MTYIYLYLYLYYLLSVLIFSFTFSTDQEEMFKMMENLLVCLRHCYNELLKTKGPDSITVVCLHQFQYHILMQALQYFHDDLQDNGMVGGGASERFSRTLTYVPTLQSNAQLPGTLYMYVIMSYIINRDHPLMAIIVIFNLHVYTWQLN